MDMKMNNLMMISSILGDESLSNNNIESGIVYGNALYEDCCKSNASDLDCIRAVKKEYERWGNVIRISDDGRYVFIKPLGMKYQDMLVVDMSTGKVVDGRCNHILDTLAQTEKYKNNFGINMMLPTINQLDYSLSDTGILVRNRSIHVKSPEGSENHIKGMVK